MAEQPEEPAAEAEEPANASKDDSKDDEKAKDLHPERIPKEDPGDGLPTKTPDEIEFKWNKEMVEKKACDTQHMLYLLQCALELVRKRTIERNKYFKSIGRTDRFIAHLDNPQIITNFLEWHNLDKDTNKFDGNLLETGEKLHMINEVISKIGDVRLGPATKIYTKLKKDVVIERTTWLELPQPKLKLQTWGKTKMYSAEKVLDECTVAEVVLLLQNGVLAQVVEANAAKGKGASALEKVEDWQAKLVQWFEANEVDGNKLVNDPVKQTCKSLMDHLEKGNNKLRGPVNQVIRALKKCYVHDVLASAKKAEN